MGLLAQKVRQNDNLMAYTTNRLYRAYISPEMENIMTISELQEKVKQLKLNPHQLSMLAGISAPSVYKLLEGTITNPSYITMQKLEKAVLDYAAEKR